MLQTDNILDTFNNIVSGVKNIKYNPKKEYHFRISNLKFYFYRFNLFK